MQGTTASLHRATDEKREEISEKSQKEGTVVHSGTLV